MRRGSSQGENQRKLKQIGQELSRINTSANRLKSLKGELRRAVGIVRIGNLHRWSQLSSAIFGAFLYRIGLCRAVKGSVEQTHLEKKGSRSKRESKTKKTVIMTQKER